MITGCLQKPFYHMFVQHNTCNGAETKQGKLPYISIKTTTKTQTQPLSVYIVSRWTI